MQSSYPRPVLFNSSLCCPLARLPCSILCLLPLDLYVQQQPVLSLIVAILEQPLLPLDSLCFYSRLSCSLLLNSGPSCPGRCQICSRLCCTRTSLSKVVCAEFYVSVAKSRCAAPGCVDYTSLCCTCTYLTTYRTCAAPVRDGLQEILCCSWPRLSIHEPALHWRCMV